jgi:hypothetical protein
MAHTLTPRRARLLDIQGFDTVDMQQLAPVALWLRLAFGLCALLGGLGTVLASPTILLALALIAALAAASPVHPFDLIYNYGIRHLTGTGPLPRRGVPTRLGCGMGAVLVLVTDWTFSAGWGSIPSKMLPAARMGQTPRHPRLACAAAPA